MKISIPQNLANISTIQDLTRYVSNTVAKVQTVLNGGVDLLENGNNAHVSFTFTKLLVDVGVPHNLGRVPRGYTQTGSDNHALSLQNGSTPNTATLLYLQAGSTGTATVLVF